MNFIYKPFLLCVIAFELDLCEILTMPVEHDVSVTIVRPCISFLRVLVQRILNASSRARIICKFAWRTNWRVINEIVIEPSRKIYPASVGVHRMIMTSLDW